MLNDSNSNGFHPQAALLYASQAEHQRSQDDASQVGHHSEYGSSTRHVSETLLQQAAKSSTLGARQAAVADHPSVAHHVHANAVSSQASLDSTGAVGAVPQGLRQQQDSEADTAITGGTKDQQPRELDLQNISAPCEAVNSSGQAQPQHTRSPCAR